LVSRSTVQPLARHRRQRRLVQQHAARCLRCRAPPARATGATAQAQALGVLDHHQAGVRHVHADFDHRGGHQQVQLATLNACITACFSPASAGRGPGRCAAPAVAAAGLEGLLCRLPASFDVPMAADRVVDQGADPVGLATLGAGGRMRSINSARRSPLTATVWIGVRPGGNSSIAETSRSA
jgi:hypothetical protein